MAHIHTIHIFMCVVHKYEERKKKLTNKIKICLVIESEKQNI